MIKVSFINVGMHKKSWTALYDDEGTRDVKFNFLYNQVKRNAFVRSENIDFIPYEGNNKSKGIIAAGIHKIGEYEFSEG